MPNLPVVCVFGVKEISLKSPDAPDFETRDLDCRCYPTDSGIFEVLSHDRPSAVISIGPIQTFQNLSRMPFMIRKMWVHFENADDINAVGHKAFYCFLNNAISDRNGPPLVSVFTPAFRSGNKIERPWRSLLGQSWLDWEWVIVDDSDDDGETFRMLSEMAKKDFRIKVFKESRPSGNIGYVKRTACGMARGKYLVELDHDDEMTRDALALVVEAFEAHPEAGFVYTDGAECAEDGAPVTYGPGWGMGYGKYKDDVIGGIKYQSIISPNINPKTIRHIVAAPNHIRAWRKSFYDDIGGHRDLLHVADDYELMVRTFLRTRMVRINKTCYIQYRNSDGNTSLGVRNRDIQRLVRYIEMSNDEAIHKRFLELGVDDFVWKEGETTFFRLQNIPNPEVEPHCTITHEPK